MPYNCTHVLFLVLRSNSYKKFTLTLLTHKSTNHNIISYEINHFLYKLTIKGQLKVELADFYFCALGTNGLNSTVDLFDSKANRCRCGTGQGAEYLPQGHAGRYLCPPQQEGLQQPSGLQAGQRRMP